MKPMTRAILALLREHPDGITALDALDEAGCFRLASRVDELRQDGYMIRTTTIRTPSGKHVARYRLTEQLEVGL